MKFHAFIRRLRAHWQRKPLLRRIISLSVFLAAIALEYYLMHVPRPVDVIVTGKFGPLTAKRGQQEIIIENPFLTSGESLISHSGDTDEIVDAIFEKAKLAPDTLALFQGLGLNPPAGADHLSYVTDISHKSDIEQGCKTFIDIQPVKPNTPLSKTQIHFYQKESSSANPYPLIEMKVDSLSLMVRIDVMPPDGNPNAAGCRKWLVIGKPEKWKVPVNRQPVSISVIIPAGKDFRFRFQPSPKSSSLWDSNGVFKPFNFHNHPLKVATVGIKALQKNAGATPNETGTPGFVAVARSVEGGVPITVSDPSVKADEVQMQVTGEGWVELDGRAITVNLLPWLTDNPLLAGLFAALNAALLGWLFHEFKRSRNQR